MKSLGYFLLSLLCAMVPPSYAQVDELAQRVLHSYAKKEAWPNLSHEPGMDMSRAYQVQTAVVRSRLTHDAIAGFKAGLTSDGAQAHFGINRPIFGILFKSGDYSQVPIISLKKFNALMVETELGFITKKPITKIVNSVAELKSYVGEIVPVIELPEVGFTLNPIYAIDLVAANACAAAYIVHKGVNWYGEDINSLTVSLMHDGVIVNQGQGSDAFGDQWEALRWLVNQVLAHGWSIDKGSLLITGALGEMVPAQPGNYKAQFNGNVTVEFTFAP